MTKTCSRCREVLPVTMFHRRKRNRDGRVYQCKTCTREAAGHKRRKTTTERFWERVNKAGPTAPHMDSRCWLWTHSTHASGYGSMSFKGRNMTAHRISFQMHTGKPAKGRYILHHCDNKLCVRPSHLYSGTLRQNNADRVRRGRSALGERSGAARFTNEQVRAIRTDPRSHRAIARDFGVSHSTIGRIKRLEGWTHV